MVFFVAVAALAAETIAFSAAKAQTRDCVIGGDIGPIGTNSTGTIEMKAGETCRLHLTGSGTLDSSHVSKQPSNGTLTMELNGGATYTPKDGFTGTDEFAVTLIGRGPTTTGTTSGNTTSVVTIRASVK
jgi:hypothetical protein